MLQFIKPIGLVACAALIIFLTGCVNARGEQASVGEILREGQHVVTDGAASGAGGGVDGMVGGAGAALALWLLNLARANATAAWRKRKEDQ